MYLAFASPQTSSDPPWPNASHISWPLLDLAPSGVCLANAVTNVAVRSYRTFSPLPFRAVCFCSTFRKFAPPRCYLALYSMEPGLSSGLNQQLPDQHSYYHNKIAGLMLVNFMDNLSKIIASITIAAILSHMVTFFLPSGLTCPHRSPTQAYTRLPPITRIKILNLTQLINYFTP